MGRGRGEGGKKTTAYTFGPAILLSDSVLRVMEISKLLVSARENIPSILTSPLLIRSLYTVFTSSQRLAFILIGGWSLFRTFVVDDHQIKERGSDVSWARMDRTVKWKLLGLKMGHSPGPSISPCFCTSSLLLVSDLWKMLILLCLLGCDPSI